MSLRRKILLPILVTLFIIISFFSYLLFQLYAEQKLIEENSVKIDKLNDLNNQLRDLQFKTDFNVLAFKATQDESYLEIINNAAVQKFGVLDQIYPLIDNQTGLALVDSYVKSRRNIEDLRNDFISSIQNNDYEQEKIDYAKWIIQTQYVRAALADFDAHNLNTISRLTDSIQEIRNRVFLVTVFILGTIIGLILFLYYYLSGIITKPILKLARITERISDANFISSEINIDTDDEIGSLAKNFKIMNLKLKRLYQNLELKVRQRTRDLRELNEKHEIVTNYFPNGGVALINRNYRILTIGGEEFTTLGFSAQEAVGKNFVEVFPKKITKLAKPFFKKTLAGEATSFEVEFSNKTYMVRNIPIKNQKGEVVSFISMAQNITSEKEFDQQKNAFIGIASHELKTPITALSAYTQILEKRLRSNKQNHYFIKHIRSQTDKLVRLIDDLLNVSKIDSAKLDLNLKEIDPNILIGRIVRDFQYTTQTHSIEKEGVIKGNVVCDENRIEQVIINLLTNAIKYSPNSKQIIVHLSNIKDEAVVAIEDFGFGIAKEDLSKVFQRFFRSKNTAEGHVKGFGLGLFICAEIIKKHGGRIWAESEKDEGSIFSFSLPIVK
jgi:signal transduction histidine kinase